MENGNKNRDRLERILTNGSEFPRNSFEDEVQEHSLNALESLLNCRAPKLFCEDAGARVTLYELYREAEGYQKHVLKDLKSYYHRLTVPLTESRTDPRRRFFFIDAPNARAPLRITRKMLSDTLTYHQVMPAFMHYIFPFGDQHYVRDFHVMGYRSASSIETPRQSLAIPKMCRSGRNIEMCYSLKSVERKSSSLQPWSIRQCSVYHRFDLDYEQMVWIVVKGNNIIQKAVENRCNVGLSGQSANHRPLPATLAIHEILASWAGENWHWYINDLETELQSSKTSRGMYIPLESTRPGTPPRRSPTIDSKSSPKAGWRHTLSYPKRTLSKVFARRSNSLLTVQSDDATIQADESMTNSSAQIAAASPPPHSTAVDDFSFEDLQDVHHLELKATEALFILQANTKVIRDLRQEYKTLMTSPSCPTAILDSCHRDVALFELQLSSIEQDLEMQQNKVNILLRMISDRKNLVQGILQFRNTQASKELALRAQESAENMEKMTQEMHEIAKKTKVETVSMRIITLVTLFFLPGTFISTLMSTPMVHFDTTKPGISGKNIGVGALELYLALSIPLVLLTFLAWALVYKWEKRKEIQAQSKPPDIEKGEKQSWTSSPSPR